MTLRYNIDIRKKALKYISKQPKNQQKLIFDAIDKLPDAGDIASVQGRAGYFRLRVGDHRIIYTVNHGHLLIIVVDANTRGQIYKRY